MIRLKTAARTKILSDLIKALTDLIKQIKK
jgi:hypothetical protein